jgi:hypothetical protein
VRQAAVVAGIVQNPARLEHFNKLWRNASDVEQQEIAVDVTVWLMCQDPAHRDQLYIKAEKRMVARQSDEDERYKRCKKG